MSTEGELWHIVEAKRDDGTPTMFRIRELAPRKQLDRIFVVEMPYPATELSRLPNATAYRRLADFDEQWLRPACTALGWELVGSKTEDGSFFLYMYGAGDPNDLITRLSPFDSDLGFYDDSDPDWLEYGTLRELLDQAKAIPQLEAHLGATPDVTIPVKAKPKTAALADKKSATKAAVKKPKKPTAKAAPRSNATKKATSKPTSKPKRTSNSTPRAKRAKTEQKTARRRSR